MLKRRNWSLATYRRPVPGTVLLAENWHTCSLSGSSKGVTSSIACLPPLAIAMAASSGDDVPTQLAALLGREIFPIRKTDETPPRISAVDVVEAITGKTKSNARNSLDCVKERYPEVPRNLT